MLLLRDVAGCCDGKSCHVWTAGERTLTSLHAAFCLAVRLQETSELSSPSYKSGARGGAVGCCNVLQAGRSRVPFPVMLLEFFSDIILPAALLTQPLTEMSTRNISWGVKAASA